MNDVAIVGAGPAGISASIYLKRAGFEPLVIERDEVGGLLLNANLVENYPGFSPGVSGEHLVKLFTEQFESLGIEIKKAEVLGIRPENEGFTIHTSDGDFLARSVIVATGTAPLDIGIDCSKDLIGKRIFFEVKHIPSPRKGKRFAVLGSGDGAFDYALNLANDDCHVRIIMRSDKPKCLKLLEERVSESPRIEVIADTELVAVREEKDILVLGCVQGTKTVEFDSDYLLIACGRVPNLAPVRSILGENEGAAGVVTEVPGLFIAGDVRSGDHRQVGIAVGDGINAAMSAVSYLEGGNE
jgi:thioredoxin reductase (NADPH)